MRAPKGTAKPWSNPKRWCNLRRQGINERNRQMAKGKSGGYAVALFGAKGLIKILIYILIVILSSSWEERRMFSDIRF